MDCECIDSIPIYASESADSFHTGDTVVMMLDGVVTFGRIVGQPADPMRLVLYRQCAKQRYIGTRGTYEVPAAALSLVPAARVTDNRKTHTIDLDPEEIRALLRLVC